MKRRAIVLDTNVLVSALRSKRGASYRLLSLLGGQKFQLCISVPLILEYEAAAKKKSVISSATVEAIIDFICVTSAHHQVHFLWRPCLKDPKDDMVLELAVAAGCHTIVTYNGSDFKEAKNFGIRVIKPQDFLEEIGG